MKQALFGAKDPDERARYVAAYAKIMATLTEMNKRGILLIPGTDTGGAFTLHRELELFTRLGMSNACLLYTSPSPRDRTRSRLPSSASTKKKTTVTHQLVMLI